MTQQTIGIGTVANDGTGDSPRSAFDKANQNFTELYARLLAPQGRLTLQTATPVMTTTQSAKTAIFYTPYVGDQSPIYNGTSFVMTPFTELTVATTDTTKSPAAIGASKVNDWFKWSDSGTLRIGHGPDWTNDTTRSAGTALVLVKGILLNNAAITNGPAAQRGTYVGTTRSDSSSKLNWIIGGLNTPIVAAVWNAYNRVLVRLFVGDSGDSWTYALTTVRSAGGVDTVRASFVSGLAEDAFAASYNIGCGGPTGCINGIGYDVTNAFSGRQGMCFAGSGSAVATVGGDYATPALGYHFFQACEAMTTAGSGTWYGDDGFPTLNQSGMLFSGMM